MPSCYAHLHHHALMQTEEMADPNAKALIATTTQEHQGAGKMLDLALMQMWHMDPGIQVVKKVKVTRVHAQLAARVHLSATCVLQSPRSKK